MEPTDRELVVFEEQRQRLFGVAYRMLGSVADAEDVVQEAFLRWRDADRSEIREPAAWLTTVVTRLCIDQLKSARVRRERYVGPWLPEPILGELDPAPDASAAAELSDSLSMAFLVLLEELSPTERAAFLLREVFDYPYGEIAEALGATEASCRQLVHRAKERVAERRRRFDADREKQRELLGRFLLAAGSGDVDQLVELLAADAVCYTDGGGETRAARRPVVGSRKVARFVVAVRKDFPPDATFEIVDVNGSPGIVIRSGGELWNVMTIAAADGRIQSIYAVLNPRKLRERAPHPS